MADEEAGVVCGYAKKPKKRNKKPLPFAIAALVDSEDHRSKFITALEKDAKKRRRSDGRAEEALVAQFVQVNVDGKETLFDLQTLSLDHLRLLCRNMGLLNCGSLHKFACRKRLAFQTTTTTTTTQHKGGSLKEQRALPPSLQASQITKNRRDHEKKHTNQGLRLRASDAHHCLIGTEIAFGSSKPASGSKHKLDDDGDDGSTSSNEESLDDSSSSGKILKLEEFMSQIVAQGAVLVQQMTAFTAMQEKEAEARRKDAEARRKDAEARRKFAEDQAEHRQKEAAIRENAVYFERRLRIALALNDMDELRKLKDEAEKEAK